MRKLLLHTPTLALALALMMTPACTSTEITENDQLQEICVSSGNGTDGQTTELAFNVTFNACLSSSCDRLVESSCEAAVSGDVLEVSGLATIESTIGTDCTSDCGLVEAHCTVEVDNGIYTVRAGDIEFEYEVGTPAACSE